MSNTMSEKGRHSPASCAADLVEFITDNLPIVTEMRNNRGQRFSSTLYYQIRIKPIDKDSIELDSLLKKLEKVLTTSKAKKFGISDVLVNERSVNSGKYSSVSFKYLSSDYDIVVALGGNKGESFERELLLKMDAYLASNHVDRENHAKAAFDALATVDRDFSPDNIERVLPRVGSTQRSLAQTPEEAGQIIADIVVKTKTGLDKFISVKNSDGATVAQFGVSKAFNDDLTVNTHSTEWKQWLAPFDLDPKKIQKGLEASASQVDVSWHDIEHHNIPIKSKHPVFKIMQQLWGAGYYYLRESRGGFTALKIDRHYVDNVMLKNLNLTEVRYPSKNRKQINVYMQSDHAKFKLEVRNPRGRGSAKPTQIQLKVMKSVS